MIVKGFLFKPRLLAQAGRAADLDKWVALLSPEPEATHKTGTFSFVASGGFVGHWDIQTDNLTQWVADENGIDGDGWIGKTSFGKPVAATPGDW